MSIVVLFILLISLHTISHRPQQISKEILKGLGQILQETFPFEYYGFITITAVDVTSDLDIAKVFIMCSKEPEETLNSIKEKTAKLRAKLGKKIKLRKIPQLIFEYDDRSDRGERIEQLLENQ